MFVALLAFLALEHEAERGSKRLAERGNVGTGSSLASVGNANFIDVTFIDVTFIDTRVGTANGDTS